MTGTMTVRPAGRDDAREVAVALGRAGLDETVFSWVVPDEQARRARVEAWTDHALGWVSGVLDTGEILVAQQDGGEILGLSVWEFFPGGPARPDPAAAAEQAAFVARAYGEYAPRMALVAEVTRARHPDREPYWYLQQMAVVPASRGQGLGAAMLRHQVAKADAAGIGAYLEASSPRNRALYARHGFRARGEPIWLPDGGPGIQPMWREPRGDPSTAPSTPPVG
ncbi:GNAT family N-acetyltransferase [Plantactinospora sp. S1510]|uniref:GNAT family N-acetyltransferase n=1 Tax=Plantactinospora alkalitolerans TaxID=2789879 RepID=A0ABS0H0I9_9ACTN|nr:GNAT family N-acetyltransferase [Plantactinospora alkalitolerans]MBF9131637.1 GNAT family N-acetyltransferase [Plantactinospora alkalitolerans]